MEKTAFVRALDTIATTIEVVRRDGLQEEWDPLVENPWGGDPDQVEQFRPLFSVPDELAGDLVLTQRDMRDDDRKGANASEYKSLKAVDGKCIGGPISIRRYPQDRDVSATSVWTNWKTRASNRTEFWEVRPANILALTERGVVVRREDGAFHAYFVEDYRGSWAMHHRADGQIVGVPMDAQAGAFRVRKDVLLNADVRSLIEVMDLSEIDGVPAELEPWRGGQLLLGDKYARVEWYSVFTGQSGQGIARLPAAEGQEAEQVWLHGQDLVAPTGVIRYIDRGDVLSYDAIEHWGDGGRSKKLVGVRRLEGL